MYCKDGTISNCTVCALYNSIQYVLSGTTCYTACPAGTYQNSTNTCASCASSCTTCNGTSSTNCVTCTLPRYFLSTNNSCMTSCPNGYF